MSVLSVCLFCLCVCSVCVSVLSVCLFCLCVCSVCVSVLSVCLFYLCLFCLCVCSVCVSVLSVCLFCLCVCSVCDLFCLCVCAGSKSSAVQERCEECPLLSGGYGVAGQWDTLTLQCSGELASNNLQLFSWALIIPLCI